MLKTEGKFEMANNDLTGEILAACFEVSNELGAGFLESVYEKALLIALRQKGLSAEAQVRLEVQFRGIHIGEFFADILVENKILLELKAVTMLGKEHFAQILNYLKASKIEKGLIINFGNAKLEYRRFDNRFVQPDFPSEKTMIDKLLSDNSNW